MARRLQYTFLQKAEVLEQVQSALEEGRTMDALCEDNYWSLSNVARWWRQRDMIRQKAADKLLKNLKRPPGAAGRGAKYVELEKKLCAALKEHRRAGLPLPRLLLENIRRLLCTVDAPCALVYT